MKVSSTTLPYIQGAAFDDALPVKIEQEEVIEERMDFVETLVAGRRVLHIGCLDHVPLIPQRIECDRWFHGRITRTAAECLGVDINQEGIEWVRSELNISNICYGDIEQGAAIGAITSKHWDYAVFGEVIEHIDNPVLFLRQFMTTYGNYIDKVVITVPNAFRASNLRLAFKSLEVINSDHRYWFTPYTIWKILNQAGLTVEKIQMCKFDHTGNALRDKIRDFVLRRRPLLAESIVVVCRPS